METKQKEIVIDFLALAKVLWKKIIFIIVFAIIGGAIGYGYSTYAITPKYTSEAMIVVNATVSSGKENVSSSEISASRSLANTYSIIMRTKTSLGEAAQKSHLTYSAGQLRSMVSISSVSNTEILKITVTCPSAGDAMNIANAVADYAVESVSKTVEGSKAAIVDYAVRANKPSSPSIPKYSALGAAVATLVACLYVIVKFLLDDVIHDEDYLTSEYPDIPLLAVIPDLTKK